MSKGSVFVGNWGGFGPVQIWLVDLLTEASPLKIVEPPIDFNSTYYINSVTYSNLGSLLLLFFFLLPT